MTKFKKENKTLHMQNIAVQHQYFHYKSKDEKLKKVKKKKTKKSVK